MSGLLNMHGHANTWQEELTEVSAERDRLRAELDQIKARGYGALYADELRAAGHRPWLHGDADDCWCTARQMFGRDRAG